MGFGLTLILVTCRKMSNSFELSTLFFSAEAFDASKKLLAFVRSVVRKFGGKVLRLSSYSLLLFLS